jgi:hypothetical protein
MHIIENGTAKNFREKDLSIDEKYIFFIIKSFIKSIAINVINDKKKSLMLGLIENLSSIIAINVKNTI